MTFKPLKEPTGAFPRLLTPSLLWTGGCLEVPFDGEFVHSHLCVYVVKGSEKTILIDPGHPVHRRDTMAHVVDFLQGRKLDYIFPTHCELAHMGLMPDLLERFPESTAVGMLGDYPLYYPQFADRMRNVTAGDAIDLGDRRIVFLPSVWQDLKETLWAFDTKDKVLFVSDAFAFLHYHTNGECDKLATEQPLPDLRMIKFFNERALHWTRFTDPQLGYADIDEILRVLKPALVATAHGGVIDSMTGMLPLAKKGMVVGDDENLRGDTNDVSAAALLRSRLNQKEGAGV